MEINMKFYLIFHSIAVTNQNGSKGWLTIKIKRYNEQSYK
jgi:hypothetical protein